MYIRSSNSSLSSRESRANISILWSIHSACHPNSHPIRLRRSVQPGHYLPSTQDRRNRAVKVEYCKYNQHTQPDYITRSYRAEIRLRCPSANLRIPHKQSPESPTLLIRNHVHARHMQLGRQLAARRGHAPAHDRGRLTDVRVVTAQTILKSIHF